MKTRHNPSVATLMLAACIITANTSTAVTERFTSGGTFTPPAGITSITVECWGGGGAGGAASKSGSTASGNNAIGGGGAGGAYARRNNVPVTPGTPYTITIPAVATNNILVVDTRVDGASVTFTGDGGIACTAVGGQGGETAVSTGTGNTGLAGIGSTDGCVGDVFFAGGNGAIVGGGGGPSDLAAGVNANSSSFALGSDAIHNGGLGAQNKTGSGPGNNGGVPGAGGGGARSPGSGSTGSNNGGNGARGQVIITYTGATLVKADNADDLNLTTSWVGGSAPDSTGIAKWDETVTSANTTVLGADLTWGGINIANPGGLVTINAGNTLTNNGGIDMSSAMADLTLNCGLALGGPAVWNVAENRTLTVGGMVSGAQAITKQGSGRTILSAANTYSGSTTINGGTLQLGASDVIPQGSGNGDVAVASTCTLDLNSYSDSINGLSGAGIVDNTAASTSSTLTVGGNNASSNFSGVIQNSGSASALNLVKTGSGTLTLSGANTFSGTVTVNGGRLALANVSALANMSGLTIGGASLSVANVNNLVVSGPITLTGNLTVVPNGGGVLLYSLNGPIGGTGNLSFTTEANTFGGADNRASIGASGDFAGNVTVTTQNPANNMTVQLGAANALPSSTVVTLDGGDGNGSTYSDLDLHGFNQTLAGLTNVTRASRLQRVYNANTNPAVTLTINNSTDHTFGGRLGKTGDTNLALTKSGSGTQTLSGTNTYSGATTVAAGTLALVGGSQASPITVNNLAALGFTLGSPTASTAAVVFDAGSSVAITGTPVPATSYTLLTTTATISGTPSLVPDVPGFKLEIEGSNTLKLVPITTGGYAGWQSENGTTQTADLDHDLDGVSNGVEFFIGGTTDTTGFTPLPGVTNTLGTYSVTWTRDATYTGTYGPDFVVETSDTLAGPWTTEIADPNPGFTVAFPSATEVKYTFPSPLVGRNFVRLKVTP